MALPYFPFYPDRWLGSGKIDLMAPEQEGAYIRLLARSWGQPECTLPRDEKILLRWSRLENIDQLRELLKLCFDRVDGGYQNAPLRAEWERSKEKHEKASRNAKVRWNK